jgi:hypothetical protein
MTQPRTRKWTPGDEQVTPEEEDARAMDPATSRALASLQTFVQPPPISNKTLTGYARPGESQHRPSQPPPAPIPPVHRTTATWAPSPPKQPPPMRPYRRTTPKAAPPPAPAPVAEPFAEQLPAAPSAIASEPPPPAVVSVAPRAQETRDWKALSGWITAAAMLAFGIAFYSLAYVPVRSDLANFEQAAATQLKQRDAELTALRAELVASQGRELRAAAAAAAAAPVQIAPVEVEAQPRRGRAKTEPTETPAEPKHAAAEPKHAAAEPAAVEPKVAEARTEHEANETSEGKTKGKVDVAAAAAATAALEAQVYGSGPKPEGAAQPAAPASEAKTQAKAAVAPRPTPAPEGKEAPSQPAEASPKATDKKDSLADIERGPSDDPLEGL